MTDLDGLESAAEGLVEGALDQPLEPALEPLESHVTSALGARSRLSFSGRDARSTVVRSRGRAFASAGIVPVGPADSGAREPRVRVRDTEPGRTDGEWRTTSLVRCVAPGEWRNWQTRRLQVPVSERMWGFKSPLAHRL